jgi:flavin reductase (DIM6/NTAB) family NADH-FMN oxidoreductase RutF
MVTDTEKRLARVMEAMPYGLYIIGSRSAEGDDGMMADWVMQTSFRPRLIAAAFENDAHTLANIRQTSTFTINLLAQDERSMTLARGFAQPYLDAKIGGRRDAEGTHHKLDETDFTRAENGCAVLSAAVGWIECRAQEFIPAGDHTLVIALVTGGDLRRDTDLLTSTYTGWSYGG